MSEPMVVCSLCGLPILDGDRHGFVVDAQICCEVSLLCDNPVSHGRIVWNEDEIEERYS